jgi:hypothetical protein
MILEEIDEVMIFLRFEASRPLVTFNNNLVSFTSSHFPLHSSTAILSTKAPAIRKFKLVFVIWSFIIQVIIPLATHFMSLTVP